jgi:hypothetical protein
MRRSRFITDGDLLSGWKEIGKYLQCDSRTAQRWELQDNLPILRPNEGGKGPVFASRHALNAWLKGGIEQAVITGNRLVAFGRAGKILWEHEFSTPLRNYTREEVEWRLQLVDIHGRGNRGVLATIQFHAAGTSDRVFYFSSGGTIEWTLEPKPQLSKRDGTDFENAWIVKHAVIVSAPESRAVYLAMANAAGWGGCILRVDAEGREVVQFANAGHIECLCRVTSPDGDLLVACGENNDFDCAFAALLGADDSPACSVPGKRLVYRFANAPDGQARKYLLFPKTELISARRKPYGHATRVRQHQDRLIVEVETGGEGACFLYHFSEHLEPMYVFPSGNHEFVHQALENTGALTHSWKACPELDRPLVLKVWTPNLGWHAREVSWRDNPWREE